MESEIAEKPENFEENINSIRDKVGPYQRPILYIAVSLFLMLILFFGFAIGAYKVCRQFDGFLDDTYKCYADYYKEKEAQQFIPAGFITLPIE